MIGVPILYVLFLIPPMSRSMQIIADSSKMFALNILNSPWLDDDGAATGTILPSRRSLEVRSSWGGTSVSFHLSIIIV